MVGGKQPCQSRQHGSIRRLQRGSVDLASEDRRLVAQHDDLDREVRIFASDEADQLDDATERPVEEREGHGRMLAAPGVSRQSPAHSRWMTFSARRGSGGEVEGGRDALVDACLEDQEPGDGLASAGVGLDHQVSLIASR